MECSICQISESGGTIIGPYRCSDARKLPAHIRDVIKVDCPTAGRVRELDVSTSPTHALEDFF